ncbi:tetratricopeptide repeat protein [Streptomyces mirabilis]|uniref:tetratricopeptide repeat protein n=1 Tax=Streptomyces mirabilis TaxID=68239 RepID=UPI00368260CB
MAPSQRATLHRLQELSAAGEFEEAEARARALAAAPRVWGGDPLIVSWLARSSAATAAIRHGRGAETLPELETLITEVERTVEGGPELRAMLLGLRSNRVAVLVQQDRCTEAEAEAKDILRAITRLAHLTEVRDTELAALINLAAALNGQGRYEEAEAIARGNLTRADELTADDLRHILARSLNGQARYEEALVEVRRLAPVNRADSGAVDLAKARALHGLGRRSEAETTARQALTVCEQFLHPAHPRIQDARTLLTRIAAEDPAPE